MEFQSNPQLDLAFDYVRRTNRNIFLTGKAGTGKTTFLHQLKKECPKRMVVVAPTGVAAINAGGVTIHSFFQLPFSPYIPQSSGGEGMGAQRKFGREKINLIQSLDLLIIDEISMVRADTLDAIDEVLRRYKNRNKLFGGVQLLMIGDLHQLAPVVKDEEWNMLRPYYDTAYFFGSNALKASDPVSVELKHIYRQADDVFIDLLNKVRANQIDQSVLDTLNSRYIPNFAPDSEEGYITLTSHNATAQDINSQRLLGLKTASHRFEAKVEGDFPEYSYPTDKSLELKVNAQVMYVKNDISRDKLYYNGKIGIVTKIEKGKVWVKSPNDFVVIEVTPVRWENVKYKLNEGTKAVDEEVIGSFEQMPLKLAWAITIHKSQGLTFERAIIDANAAFAHGQVYVALSRCRTFEGIVLRSLIVSSSIRTDTLVKSYTSEMEKNPPNEADLQNSKVRFQQSLMQELFEFGAFERQQEQLRRLFLEHSNILEASAVVSYRSFLDEASTLVLSVAKKFKPQLQAYFEQGGEPENNTALQERMMKAAQYFSAKLQDILMSRLQDISLEMDNKAVKKQMTEGVNSLKKEVFVKNACFESVFLGFSTAGYLKAQADSEINFRNQSQEPKAGKLATTATTGTPKDALHPELYQRIRAWRSEMAEDMGLEEFNILANKTVIDIVNFLPLNLVQLKKIKGIGDMKLKNFGGAILEMVETFCDENGFDVSAVQAQGANMTLEFEKKVVKEGKVPTSRLSLELFLSGKSPAEIAVERNLAVSTVEGHLTQYISTGEVGIDRFLEPEQLQSISDYFVKKQSKSLQDAKLYFGEEFSYNQLKMVVKHLEYVGMIEKD